MSSYARFRTVARSTSLSFQSSSSSSSPLARRRCLFQVPRRHASATNSTSTSSSSTTANTPPSPPTPPPRPPPNPPRTQTSLLSPGARIFLYSVASAVAAYAAFLYASDTRASLLHRYTVPPLLRTLVPDAEDAHHFGTAVMKTLYGLGLHIRDRTSDDGLAVTVFGHTLANPIGISAGLDKDAEIPDALFALGPAIVEVGGITPRPQPGNPRPRVFRVPSLEGMVNRYGLNSAGADAVARSLRARLHAHARARGLTELDVLSGRAAVPPGSLAPGRLLCVQVAKAKDTPETDVRAVVADYAACVRALAPYADVLVVNVSSPNTPGLRDLQRSGPLAAILSAVVDEARAAAARHGRAANPPRVMVKVSPDEDADAQVQGVVDAVCASGVDGVIVGNTTKRRDVVPPRLLLSGPESAALYETGGFSGPALFDRTVSLVAKYRRALDGHSSPAAAAVTVPPVASNDDDNAVAVAAAAADTIHPPPRPSQEQKVIFATGGITNGHQALAVLNAGASVAMIYTGLVYGGAGTVTRIKTEMKKELKQS